MTASLRRVGALVAFPRARLTVPAPQAAMALLGAVLARTETDGTMTLVRIVETEAYREDDPASHSAAGRTDRTAPMFEPAATAYVYRSYGIHWCLNVAAEQPGVGAAVLLRAALPLRGEDRLTRRRPTARTPRELMRGPGRLCQALAVSAPEHDGTDLLDPASSLCLLDDGFRPASDTVVRGPRVGVRLAPDRPWRFFLSEVAEVSAYRRHRAAAPKEPNSAE
ncbi:DNA-3-methyladenine glycosylase [Egicoccus halophilus]|uniref:Putative 3-methyladenine DNA glycosylase n=1 Tax=Egicoccus halophilus TaxID=1670830 RepID=A0A8J3ABI9_9ACTN|nr:DNA-3-methyladenine glycosylase [Egicoccus halophilus]GGI07516.1 putative 3-methyladenine DNA glycosylase [Egicoccus halophilus]